MDGVKEYIFPVYDVDADEFKEYIGFIRTKPELIRCKDCKYRDEETANCTRFRKDWYVQSNSFCSWAELKDTTEEVRKQLKDMEQRKEMERKK